MSILQVERPGTTPPAKRRRGGAGWAGFVVCALVAALVAGIVVNKVSDDRNQAKRADQRPTAVSCATMLGAGAAVNSLSADSTKANAADTLKRLTGQADIFRRVQSGTSFDRTIAQAFLRDIDSVQKQIGAGTYGKAVKTDSLSADSLRLVQACATV